MNLDEKNRLEYIESNDHLVLSEEKKQRLIMNLKNWETQQKNAKDSSEQVITVTIKQTDRSRKKKLAKQIGITAASLGFVTVIGIVGVTQLTGNSEINNTATGGKKNPNSVSDNQHDILPGATSTTVPQQTQAPTITPIPTLAPTTALASYEATIFHADEDYNLLESETVDIHECTPQNIIDALVQYQMINSDCMVNSFEEKEVKGIKTLYLDMNDKFQELMEHQGTAGEYLIIGSMVNSFLTAYDAKQMKITADGKTIETGHAIYDSYLKFYSQEGSE